MDGSLTPPVTLVGNDKPYLQFDQDGHTHFIDTTLNDTWPLLRGWHEELSFNGTTHSTFGDLAFLVHVSGLGNSGNESDVVSHLNGLRVAEVTHKVITDFFKFLFERNESKLLKCDNKGYPEITCVTTCTPGISCLDQSTTTQV
jgi:hypothetical protein